MGGALLGQDAVWRRVEGYCDQRSSAIEKPG